MASTVSEWVMAISFNLFIFTLWADFSDLTLNVNCIRKLSTCIRKLSTGNIQNIYEAPLRTGSFSDFLVTKVES